MPLLYKLYKIVRTFKDGRTDKANNHWFARAIMTGEASTDKLADEIAYATTVTPADCRAVLQGLSKVMISLLQDGYAVKLDKIGTFKLGIKTTGAETVADFSVTTNIKNIHVNFYPEYTVDTASGKRIVAMTQGCKVKETPKNDVVKE